MNIAVAVSAQEVNYNLPGVKENLQLNGPVLAAMYRGDVKAWNDPQIAALNPGVNLPDTPVVPLHRSDGSGDTFFSLSTCRSRTPTVGVSRLASVQPSIFRPHRARWLRTATAAW